jgi:hypothetical protein
LVVPAALLADTGDCAPVKQRSYRMSAEAHKVVQTECAKMLELGVIRESKSPRSSPVVLVTKKNGDVRFCVDYRRLNALHTVQNKLECSRKSNKRK